MIVNMNKNGQMKLLTAILAMAVIFAGAAVVLSSESTDAASSSEITYISGEIKAETSFGDDTIVVVDRDLKIINGADLIIGTGCTFTVSEGVTITIENGSMQVAPGATVTVNGDIVIKKDGELQNNAVDTSGLVLNGNMTVEKGGVITNMISSGFSGTGDSSITVGELTVEGNVSSDVASGTTIATPTVSVSDTVVKVFASDITYHMNGAGTYGYWVGVKITDSDKIVAGQTYTITIDGKSVREAADSTGALYVYTVAGKVLDISIKGGNLDTQSFTLDTTGVSIDGPAGQIVLGATSNVDFQSTKTTQSSVGGQIFTLMDGAVLNLDTVITNNVRVETLSGANIINSSVSITGKNTMTDLTFGTESKSAGTVAVADKANTKYNYSILTVSGDVGNGVTLTVNNATNISVEEYDAENKTGADVPVRGIVKVPAEQTLSVGEKATFETAAYSVLYIDGTINISGTAGEGTKANANIDGIAYVSGTVKIADITTKVNLEFNNGPSNDYASRTAYINIVGSGKITIVAYSPGTPSEWNKNSPAGVNGVTYETDDGTNDLYVITSLDDALVAETDEIIIWGYEAVTASRAGINTNMLESPYVISKDVTIEDVTVLFAYKTVVSEGVTLTIAETADVDYQVDAVIDVNGVMIDYTMYGFVPETQADTIVALAEVRSIDADETYYKYTSLKNALSTATNGDVIELFGDAKVTGSLTIPTGVTVKTSDRTLTINIDSELIVDGVLDLVLDAEDSPAAGTVILVNPADKFRQPGKLTVNNIVVGDETQITKNDSTEYIAGIYVTDATVGDYEGQDMILAPAVAAANSANINTPAIKAETSYNGDLTFDAGDESRTISIDAKFTVETITLKNYSVSIGKGVFTRTIASASGSVKVDSITAGSADGAEAVVIANVNDTEAATDVLYISGTPVAIDKDGETTTETKDNVTSIVVVSGNVFINDETELAVSNLKTFTIDGNATLTVDGSVKFTALTINGTVVVNGALTGSGASTIEVLGTLDVKVATIDDNTNGTVTAKDVYVGMTKKDTDKTLGAEAVFNGGNTNTINGVIYVCNGSTVSEEIVKDKPSTEFYIEDTLWMTAYNMGGNNAVVSKAPVENADFLGWADENGDPIYSSGTTYATSIAINTYSKVYADVDYEIYSVTIIGDNGVGTVAIDGVVLFKVSNQFVAENLVAGEHIITFELKNGYTGTIKATLNGAEITDGKFTLSGTTDADRNIEIYLSGTTQIEYDNAINTGDDGFDLTDYLLIILVVLIVVMAIMVALRLMRS